jgi:hypothetical protein
MDRCFVLLDQTASSLISSRVGPLEPTSFLLLIQSKLQPVEKDASQAVELLLALCPKVQCHKHCTYHPIGMVANCFLVSPLEPTSLNLSLPVVA